MRYFWLTLKFLVWMLISNESVISDEFLICDGKKMTEKEEMKYDAAIK